MRLPFLRLARIRALHRQQRGLTLLELVMGLAVVAVLFGIALPEFGALLQRQRLVAAQHALSGSFHLARTHAITQRVNTAVCPSHDGQRCASGGVWDAGWLVYADRNRNGQLDADEPVLQVQQRKTDGVRLRSSAARPQAVFRPQGSSGGSGGSNLSLNLCDARGELHQRLVLNNSGRLRREAGSGRPPVCA
ncbi:MAG: GspH/FimT family pseudopilin [Aquimonas sp.]|nr:GspH/FimT family pseudopilin [Aquimonas sp.]